MRLPRLRLARSRLQALAALCLVVAFWAAVAPWTFSSGALRAEIFSQIRSTTGLRTTAGHYARFALLPRPRVEIDDVSIIDDEGAVSLKARAMRGYLRIPALLTGRLQLAEATLLDPVLTIEAEGGRTPKLGGALARASAALPASPEAEALGDFRLGVLTFSNGVVHYHGADRVIDLVAVEATLDWRVVKDSAQLKAAALWQDEPVTAALYVAAPASLLRGQASTLSGRVAAPSGVLSLEGLLTGGVRPAYEGGVTAAATALRKLAGQGGWRIPLPGPLDNVTIAGELKATANTLSISDLKLGVDGNDFIGAVAMRTIDARQSFTGTLAADELDVAPMLGAVPALKGADGAWSREPLDLRRITGGDLDLRISATRARLGRLVFEEAALSIMLKDGRMELALAEARTHGGLVKGRAFVEPAGSGVAVRAMGSLSGVDAGGFLWYGFGAHALTGSAVAQFSIETKGETVADLMRDVGGRAAVALNQGDMSGLDLEQALRRLEKRPLSVAADVRAGRTAYATGRAMIQFAHGEAVVDDGAFIGPGMTLSFAGAAQLAERTLNFKGVAAPVGAPAGDGPRLNLTLAGSWDDPTLEPDPDSLMRRSTAAAPLFGQSRALPVQP